MSLRSAGCATLAALFSLGAFGCAEHARPTTPPGPIIDFHEAEVSFDGGLKRVADLDRSEGWTVESCKEVPDIFEHAALAPRWTLPALYDAGVVRQRCHDLPGAAATYKKVLDQDPTFHRARVELALIEFESSGNKGIEPAIAELSRAVKDSTYQNTEALVNLARLQMLRANSTSDADGPDDWERAKKNLQRALAVDDDDMSAYSELAHYYYEVAKRHAKDGKADRQELDLALLVTSQASLRNPRFAPIHNTAGLIAYALGDLPLAAAEFENARTIDPTFFEAHMNYAALNLEFRGFARAESAFRAAIALRGQDYEAHLGLSLALRGQVTDSNFETMVKAADAELELAKGIDDRRPEAWFNQAILSERFKGMTDPKALGDAIVLYKEFVKRADSKPRFAEAVRDVVAVPTVPDDQCMTEASAANPACKKGRISTIEDAMRFTAGMQHP
jgi:hypothetical protein